MAHDAIRERLLSGLQVDDRGLEAAGVSTAVPLDLDALLSWLDELIWGRHDVGVRLDVALGARSLPFDAATRS